MPSPRKETGFTRRPTHLTNAGKELLRILARAEVDRWFAEQAAQEAEASDDVKQTDSGDNAA